MTALVSARPKLDDADEVSNAANRSTVISVRPYGSLTARALPCTPQAIRPPITIAAAAVAVPWSSLRCQLTRGHVACDDPMAADPDSDASEGAVKPPSAEAVLAGCDCPSSTYTGRADRERMSPMSSFVCAAGSTSNSRWSRRLNASYTRKASVRSPIRSSSRSSLCTNASSFIEISAARLAQSTASPGHQHIRTERLPQAVNRLVKPMARMALRGVRPE